MTNEQITALAREYAEYKQRTDAFKCSNKEFDVSDFEAVFHFLLRRFCLVEKSKVEEEYRAENKTLSKVPPLSIIGCIIYGQTIVLESLFPDLRKEVENEKD